MGTRIKACVDACAGIPTEQLEAGCVAKLVHELQEARNQLEEYERDLSGEYYNSPSLNAALAPFQKESD